MKRLISLIVSVIMLFSIVVIPTNAVNNSIARSSSIKISDKETKDIKSDYNLSKLSDQKAYLYDIFSKFGV